MRKKLAISSILGREYSHCLRYIYTPANMNSGTGVGLINKVQPAGEIVREVRGEAKREIQRAAGLV
jgi:NAD(P)H-dependent flavin oxidoreductase YrpB (nitropropane dioxygenase family)